MYCTENPRYIYSEVPCSLKRELKHTSFFRTFTAPIEFSKHAKYTNMCMHKKIHD